MYTSSMITEEKETRTSKYSTFELKLHGSPFVIGRTEYHIFFLTFNNIPLSTLLTRCHLFEELDTLNAWKIYLQIIILINGFQQTIKKYIKSKKNPFEIRLISWNISEILINRKRSIILSCFR